MSMVSPAAGRITSEYGRRKPIPGVTTGTFHAGIDIANDVGTPVYAAYAGTVIRTGWSIVPYRSGNGILIKNPDGERQYYGHLDSIDVESGQRVRAGQRIGKMGATGNVTGPHLHFECWSSAASSSTRDPRVDFDHWHITPGSKPKGTSNAPRPPKVKPGQSAAKVRGYQRRQNHYAEAGLLVDGVNGPVTRAWRAWARSYQDVLEGWRGVPALVKDGDYGSVTHQWTAYMQRRNGLVPDGIAGPVTLAYMRRHGSDVPDRP